METDARQVHDRRNSYSENEEKVKGCLRLVRNHSMFLDYLAAFPEPGAYLHQDFKVLETELHDSTGFTQIES